MELQNLRAVRVYIYNIKKTVIVVSTGPTGEDGFK